jgi:3-hydroxyisobutyrate dehydrogenase-like beta-hydroxyacid dehydrogenase
MAEQLLAHEYSVHVFSRSRGPVDAMVLRGAHAAGSSREVATRADVILTALPNEDAVVLVYADLAQAARPGQLYIDHSTVSPALSRRCAADLSAKDATFLDAPISGGPAGARAGTLTVMVGGDQASFERAMPLLESFGKNVRLCGPVGAGQVVKLVNQLLASVHTAAIAEAYVLGVKLGADPQVLLDLIGTSSGGSTIMMRNLPRFISRDFGSGAPMSLLLKDLDLIQGEARVAAVPIPLTTLTEGRFLEAKARGMADLDISAVVRLWEEAAGMPGPSGG